MFEEGEGRPTLTMMTSKTTSPVGSVMPSGSIDEGDCTIELTWLHENMYPRSRNVIQLFCARWAEKERRDRREQYDATDGQGVAD